MKQPKKKTTWQKVRKLFNDIHLWMGIGSGIILFLVCLSGTIYTFSSDIQEMIQPEKYKIALKGGEQKLSVEQIIAKLPDSLKTLKVTAVVIPADPARTYQLIGVKRDKKEGKPEGKGEVKKGEAGKEKGAPAGKPQRGTTYLVNPYTGEVLGTTDGPASGFFMKMFRLHRWLLLDTEIGRPIVGWATVLFCLLVISGLVIWFPQKIKTWKQGLRLKFTGNWKRTNHDLHNTLGFYASFLLLIMSLTGLTWSFEWYKTGLTKMLGTYKSADAPKEKMPESILPQDSAFVKPVIADYLAAADKILTYPGNYRVQFAADPKATVSISKQKTGFFAPAAADRLNIDQYSAAVVKTDIFREKKFGERVSASIKSLHIGDVYGTFTKWLYFLACLIATSLPITGTMIWINKWNKSKPKKTTGTLTPIQETVNA